MMGREHDTAQSNGWHAPCLSREPRLLIPHLPLGACAGPLQLHSSGSPPPPHPPFRAKVESTGAVRGCAGGGGGPPHTGAPPDGGRWSGWAPRRPCVRPLPHTPCPGGPCRMPHRGPPSLALAHALAHAALQCRKGPRGTGRPRGPWLSGHSAGGVPRGSGSSNPTGGLSDTPQPRGLGSCTSASAMMPSGECPNPDAPHRGTRRPSPDALLPPPQRAMPARKSVRCGVGDGPPHPHPPRPRTKGGGPRLHARRETGRETRVVGGCLMSSAPWGTSGHVRVPVSGHFKGHPPLLRVPPGGGGVRGPCNPFCPSLHRAPKGTACVSGTLHTHCPTPRRHCVPQLMGLCLV